jgi:hypothetical protein
VGDDVDPWMTWLGGAALANGRGAGGGGHGVVLRGHGHRRGGAAPTTTSTRVTDHGTRGMPLAPRKER